MIRSSRSVLVLLVAGALLAPAAGLSAAPLAAQEPPDSFPAPPEQPPAERRPDEPEEPPPGDVEPYDSPTDAEDAEVGIETEIEPPLIEEAGEQADETTDVLEAEADAEDGAWAVDPLWVMVGLVFVVVVVILLFSGRRR